jgi:hypothetical protein
MPTVTKDEEERVLSEDAGSEEGEESDEYDIQVKKCY